MSRTKKLIRNLIILAGMIFIYINIIGIYMTPLQAHQNSERSGHYGPSDIKHIENFKKGKYYLCTYDKWVSCNTVKKTLVFFWAIGSQYAGFENEKGKKISWVWDGSEQYCKAYGIINDRQIKRVELLLEDGTVMKQTGFYDNLFLFTWEDKSNKLYPLKISGYDAQNNKIFENVYGE